MAMRNLLVPNCGHYMTIAHNASRNPYRPKVLVFVDDHIAGEKDDTINTLDIILCRRIGNRAVTESSVGFPLKYRNESRNSVGLDQTNQTLIQFDDFNTKVTRYMGHKNWSQMDDDIGITLYLPNSESENDIYFYKFRADIDISLVARMKWIVFPHEPISRRVFIRVKLFNNDELYRRIQCETQLFKGQRRPAIEPFPFSIIVPVNEAVNFP